MVKPAADGLMELYLESITAATESGDPAEATSQGNEVVSHDLSYDEAQIFMKSIREFCFAGWGKVLGQNYEDMGL